MALLIIFPLLGLATLVAVGTAMLGGPVSAVHAEELAIELPIAA